MQPVILRAQSPDIKQTSMLAHTAVVAAATLPLPTVASPATPPETTEDDDDEPDQALIEALKSKDRLFVLRVGEMLEQLINDHQR